LSWFRDTKKLLPCTLKIQSEFDKENFGISFKIEIVELQNYVSTNKKMYTKLNQFSDLNWGWGLRNERMF
jgi:hypothetical protein